MTTQDLEYSISQYLDGTLDASERAELERRLESDAAARALLGEYRRLDAALKAEPLPDVRWDALAESISLAIDRAVEQTARPYRLPGWVRVAAPLAMAASVLVAAGVGIRVYLTARPTAPLATHSRQQEARTSPPARQPAEQLASIEIFGPRADRAEGPAQVQVSIGPARSAGGDAAISYSDAVISRPSHVSVASGLAPSHDVEPMAYDMQ
ncbi:MAG TPA: hypothetical protein VFC78_11835 [Tepidisphaeraceae bacterium]|nr:hypothetical protein [Tepidisphaeraceae bacterium]